MNDSLKRENLLKMVGWDLEKIIQMESASSLTYIISSFQKGQHYCSSLFLKIVIRFINYINFISGLMMLVIITGNCPCSVYMCFSTKV